MRGASRSPARLLSPAGRRISRVLVSLSRSGLSVWSDYLQKSEDQQTRPRCFVLLQGYALSLSRHVCSLSPRSRPSVSSHSDCSLPHDVREPRRMGSGCHRHPLPERESGEPQITSPRIFWDFKVRDVLSATPGSRAWPHAASAARSSGRPRARGTRAGASRTP